MGGMGGTVSGGDERGAECAGGADLHGIRHGGRRLDAARLDGDDRGHVHPVGTGGAVRRFYTL